MNFPLSPSRGRNISAMSAVSSSSFSNSSSSLRPISRSILFPSSVNSSSSDSSTPKTSSSSSSVSAPITPFSFPSTTSSPSFINTNFVSLPPSSPPSSSSSSSSSSSCQISSSISTDRRYNSFSDLFKLLSARRFKSSLYVISRGIQDACSSCLPHDYIFWLTLKIYCHLRLREYQWIADDLANIGNIDSSRWRFESYPEKYPNLYGCMAPFILRLLCAYCPYLFGSDITCFDHLYLLLRFCVAKLEEADASTSFSSSSSSLSSSSSSSTTTTTITTRQQHLMKRREESSSTSVIEGEEGGGGGGGGGGRFERTMITSSTFSGQRSEASLSSISNNDKEIILNSSKFIGGGRPRNSSSSCSSSSSSMNTSRLHKNNSSFPIPHPSDSAVAAAEEVVGWEESTVGLSALWLERLTIVAHLLSEMLVSRDYHGEALSLLQDEILSRRHQHLPTLSLIGRICLRMGALESAEEAFGYAECLSERDSIVVRSNNGLLAMYSNDISLASSEFKEALRIAMLAPPPLSPHSATTTTTSSSSSSISKTNIRKEGGGVLGEKYCLMPFPSAKAIAANNLSVSLMYGVQLFEATQCLESCLIADSEKSVFSTAVKNLNTLYEFSSDKTQCAAYLAELVNTVNPEDPDVTSIV